MPNRTSQTGSELFIVDNSDEDWKVRRYLHDWCGLSRIIATTQRSHHARAIQCFDHRNASKESLCPA